MFEFDLKALYAHFGYDYAALVDHLESVLGVDLLHFDEVVKGWDDFEEEVLDGHDYDEG